MIAVGLVDDEPLFTAGLAMIINAQTDLRVAWQASDGDEAIRSHQRNPADILLMDIQMPGTDGVATTKHLVSAGAPGKIIVLTTFDADEYVLTAVAAGAAGFLLKNTPPDQLVDAIRTVNKGDAIISPGPTRKLFATFRQPKTRRPDSSSAGSSHRPDITPLTDREKDVLTLVARGLTNREICDQLWLSMPTVKTHIGNLLAKTGTRDRVRLVLFALHNGFAPQPE